MDDTPRGAGPLADAVPIGGPIDDPSMADRTNPRWDDPTSPEPDAQPSAQADGTPNVLPQRPSEGAPIPSIPIEEPVEQGARDLEDRDEPGSNNIREGRGGGTPNPSLAEGGEG